jgi:TolB-like protein/Tfp pilus assembly protein PilF
MQDGEIYQFGEFSLDVQDRRLTRSGQAIALLPKALDVLIALVRAGGRLVRKEELLSAVWPESFVEEGILSVHISQLRKALGNRNYIETVSRSGYRWAATAAADPEAVAHGSVGTFIGSQEPQNSIAVLPFSTLSPGGGDDYFSDGLAEDVIDALTHIPGLNVIARTSSFAFRGKDQDFRKIADVLHVWTILTGSVRRSGSRVRIVVQLVDARNGYHLWSERYDRDVADVFAIQDEIAHAIARSLSLRLAPGAIAVRNYTPHVDAYESLLRARHFLRRATPDCLNRARLCLEQAVAVDPDFAQAHVELASCFRLLACFGAPPTLEALLQSRASAYRALQIDPFLPDAHAELAAVAVFLDYDWAAAGHHFQLATVRGPIPPNVSHLYGFFYLLPLGRVEDALQELTRALKEDPLNLECRAQFAAVLWAMERHGEASEQFRQLLEIDENFWLALLVESIWHAVEGSIEAGLALAERAYAVAPNAPASIALLSGLLYRAGEREKAERLIEQLNDPTAFGVPHALQIYYTVRLDFQHAADWAEKSIEQRDPNALPGTSGSNRKRFVANGRWPALARMLRLPATPTA